MKKLLAYSVFIIANIYCVFGQNILTLQQAHALGIKNNYNILLAQNDSVIFANDATIGNAGFLPSLTVTGSTSKASNNIKQEYANGLSLNQSGVGSTNQNAGIALNWTLFDGLKMFATLDKLKEIKATGELKVRQQMENTVADITNAYYNIARQKQQFKVINDLVTIYEERAKIAETRLELGNGNKSDYLQAKVDLNEQKSAILKQKTLILNGKSALNLLLSREPGIEFDIEETTTLEETKTRDALLKDLESKNAELQLAAANRRISHLAVKELEATKMPKLSLLVNYNFARNTNQAGFALLNQNLGLTTGLSLSWNLFNGFNTSRVIQDAKIAEFGNKLLWEQTRNRLQDKLIQAYNNLQQALDLLKLEDESVDLAKENVNIMMERFKLGQSTTLELKDAQNSLLNAQTRQVNARFDAKVAETELKRIGGDSQF